MKHARLCVCASVGIAMILLACTRQSSDRAEAASERRSAPPAVRTGSQPGLESPPAARAAPPAAGDSSRGAETDSEALTPASGSPAVRAADPGAECPMQIAEAQLTTLPAMGGVALLFTTSDARSRDELRRRVLALQNAYTLGLSGDPAANDPDPETRIETRADYFDEPDGARIEIRAVHQSDVDELRRRLRADIRVMTDQQRCPAHAGGAQSPGNDRSR